MRTLQNWRLPALALIWVGVALMGCGDAPPSGPEVPRHNEHGHEEEGHEEEGHDEHGHDEHGDEGVVELSEEAIRRVGLATAPASLRSLAGRQATTGKVGFDERLLAHLGPRVSGRLVRVMGELGDSAREGQVLAVVDSMELGQARATFLRAKAHQEVAQGSFERQRSLHADQIVSEQEVIEAEGKAREATADLSAAREILRLLGLSASEIAGLAWDEASASQVSLRAPFAGRVVAKEATRGELVTPEDTLFTLADLSQVWVWVDLYERDLRHVRPGESVEVRFDAWPGETFSGDLAYVADEVDVGSRTARARVDLPNPERRFKPGMFARVLLAGTGEGAGPPVIAIPREAVQRQGEESIVFVRAADTRFERRHIEAGRITEGWVEVLAGLQAGEEVVTTGVFLLKSQASAGQLGGHHH